MTTLGIIRAIISDCKLKMSRTCVSLGLGLREERALIEGLGEVESELERQELDKAPDPYLTVTEEANKITHGSRNLTYGHPLEDFSRTAKMWAAILGVSVTAEQVGLCMIAVKISRHLNRERRENLTDIAGYAQTLEMIAMKR